MMCKRNASVYYLVPPLLRHLRVIGVLLLRNAVCLGRVLLWLRMRHVHWHWLGNVNWHLLVSCF